MAPQQILVPTDFSPFALHALDYACELAVALDATVHLLNAENLAFSDRALAPDTLDVLLGHNRAALDELVSARRARVRFGPPRVERGDARDVIVAVAAALPADLIVIGSHGRRGVRRLVLGSVAESVVRTAPCPVLIVRAPRE